MRTLVETEPKEETVEAVLGMLTKGGALRDYTPTDLIKAVIKSQSVNPDEVVYNNRADSLQDEIQRLSAQLSS